MEPDPQQTVPGITIRLATRHDIAAMMALEAHHYVGNLDASERTDGFISVLHPQDWFNWAVNCAGIHVAVVDSAISDSADAGSAVADDGGVAGFIAITPPPTDLAADASPIIGTILGLAETLEFRGRPLAQQRWALRGPVLIDRPARGRGLYSAFNAVTREAYRERYDVGVLFVAAGNPRSLHTTTTKLAAQPLAVFEVGADQYHLLAFSF